MNISVFGLGYVGCVSLGCLAQNNHHVIGVDKIKNKVDLINSGKPTIIEKNIDRIISEQFKKNNISATTDYIKAIEATDVSLISVGTPSTSEGHLNLEYVFKTAEEIGLGLKNKKEFHTIAIRSTVMPGTNAKVATLIANISRKTLNKDFAVVSNPEFLREGNAVRDFFYPPITVLGCENKKGIEKMKEVYSKIDAPIEEVDVRVAEIIKFVNNTFHTLKITFANEVGNICKALNIDSHQVMELFVKDKKLNLSPYYLKPGFAYGGACLPKDLKGLKTLAHDSYVQSPVIEAIEQSNINQKNIVIDLISKTGFKKIGILGLSFKAGTDDLRFSPIVEVAELLLGKGYELKIYDKNVRASQLTGTNKNFIEQHIPHLTDLIFDDVDKAIEDSDLIIISHNLKEFDGIIQKYPKKRFIDLVRITKQTTAENYEGICW